ncbi:MAG: sigma-70 family RNA polymerase sigma factor [Thermoguttaceae bacterium]|nr:sigma-70 family RNA polymerase sigma factor [Thermoguttaceae bacterium]MDW8038278.1 sigma-70 family RNA polymerase sigma factor [Thermoguttaceae bacterium]
MGSASNWPGRNGNVSVSSTLLLGVQRRDPAAWQRLYRIWGPVVYHHIRGAGIPPHDAEDLLQILFMKISQAIGQFQRGKFRAWLYQILRHCIAEYFRTKPRIPVAKGGSTSWFSSIPAPEGSPPLSGDSETNSFSGPPAAWDSGELLDCLEFPEAELTEKKLLIRQILEEIRSDFEDHTFRAFWRTTVDGLSSREVGRELGMSPEAVRAARYRILRRLRQELQEMGYL